jgi:tetratricopeptide (TPR) repeat protein
MSDPLDASARQLSEARQRGDADDIAEALAHHANHLLQRGHTGDARLELDEAAAIHRARGRVYDQARCTQMAATLCRFEGKLDEANDRSSLALRLTDSTGTIAVSAFAELGEIALAQGKGAEAAQGFQSALDAGIATGLVDSARAALLRKRAMALAAAGRFDEAIRDLAAAHDLLTRLGDRAGAARTLIEQATACRHAGRPDAADAIVQQAMEPAVQAQDHAALADLHLLRSARALDRHDAAAALAAAEIARTHALAANAPTPYVAAAHAIAQLAEAAGDRLRAYEALAVGWATLSDLLGREMARLAFEPALAQMRERAGAAAFDDVKRAYELRRRGA